MTYALESLQSASYGYQWANESTQKRTTANKKSLCLGLDSKGVL
jgi:hypothetical protein